MGYNRLEAIGRGLQIVGRSIVYAQVAPASVGVEAILERELTKNAGEELRKNRETRRDVSAKIIIGGGLGGGGLFVLGRKIEKRGQLRGFRNQEQSNPTPELPPNYFPPAPGSTPEVRLVYPQTLPPPKPLTAQEVRITELRNYEALSGIVGKRLARWIIEGYVQSVIKGSKR